MATIENGKSKTVGRELAEEMYARLFAPAAEIVADGTPHASILIIENRYGPPVIIGGHEFQGNDHIAHAHRESVKVEGVTCAALIMEAWAYIGEDEKIAAALVDGKIAVHDLPEKQEMLMFNIRAGDEQFIAGCKIDQGAAVRPDREGQRRQRMGRWSHDRRRHERGEGDGCAPVGELIWKRPPRKSGCRLCGAGFRGHASSRRTPAPPAATCTSWPTA